MSLATNDAGASPAPRDDAPGCLLIVDDEPQICRSLQRILRRDGYRILTAGSAAEALGILADEPVDVIVSDQRMPHTKGTEFLNEVMQRYPRTVRMILSGAADLDDITTAMTVGAIYKFLTKPIDPGLLRANVAEAFSRAGKLAAEQRAGDAGQPAGLSTREQVESTYQRLMEGRESSGAVPCLMLIHVDQYSNVVASFGYSFGEEFMSAVAEALRPRQESDCCICRGAPASFLLLTADTAPDRRLAALKSRMDQIFSGPVLVAGRSITVTVSVGGTSSSDAPSGSFAELIDQAHTAMMTASMRGGATMQIYQEDLVEVWRDRVRLESDLRQAVSTQAFEIHYQPQVDIESGRIAGVEALLRWPHPELGYVSPAEFVSIAESLGLMKKLGLWVLEAAMRQFLEWDAKSLAPRELGVNVSAYQLRKSDLVQQVDRLLAETGLAPGRLVLEITETAAIEQESAIAECLEGLRRLGVTLAIDDFGTGYANLSLLSKLDIKKLKLDRSLLPVDSEDRSVKLFGNVVAMARELGLEIVAEGVETPAELAAVYRAGCRAVQGFFYSPAVSADRLGELLAHQLADGHGHDAARG